VPDRVDGIVEQWARVLPGLDTTPLTVFGRIERLQADTDALLRPPLARAGLGNGDFNTLTALRRADPPHELTPGDLGGAMLVTSGAVTKRVDRLAAQGLVTRRTSEEDGRGRVVALTPAGMSLVDRLMREHMAAERRLLGGLTDEDVATLGALLRTLSLSMEGNAR
jgi:DNA-binding MarR family transcriptional regulator